MKNVLMMISVIFVSSFSFAGAVSLQPGSVITVNAGDQMTVRCEGEQGGGIGECIVVRGGQTDKYGRECRASSYTQCAGFYKYGVLVRNTEVYDNGAAVARWCDQQLGKN